MPIFATANKAAQKIRELIEKAPAGGIFHDSTLSPVEFHSVPNSPSFFFVKVEGRTLLVSVQDVS